ARSQPLRAGAALAVEHGPADPGLVPDPEVAFEVVHEDDQLVVVDKPPGLVVHPGAGRAHGTLAAGLLARYPDLAALAEDGDPLRPGIVHRLDRGTSGLLVVARTPEARRSLVAQLAARTATRRYLGLVAGDVAGERGVVEAPVGRSTRTPTRMAVSARGREARTRYRVLRRYGEPLASTLLAVALDTGRTHQIRVHLAAIGHPVVGDERYGPGGRVGGPLLAPGRLFLHAAELSLDHPATGDRLTWRSALPPDLAAAVAEPPGLPPD
ncbi:MAG: RluA family pseudouridine synthase, partial [Acidimicrobiales bacterium]